MKNIYKIVCLVMILLAGVHIKAQTCPGPIVNLPSTSGTVTVNNIDIDVATSGVRSTWGGPYPVCGVLNAMSASPLWVGGPTSPQDDPSPIYLWDINLDFEVPVNDLVIIVSAVNLNENFVFESDGGPITITSSNSCGMDISGNEIIGNEEAQLLGSGGGGFFRISAPKPFTKLKVSGHGGRNGSMFGICSLSVVGSPDPSADAVFTDCTADTGNLSDAFDGVTDPAGAELRWFATEDRSTPQLTPAEIAAAPVGTYYAFYYYTSTSTYSPGYPVEVKSGYSNNPQTVNLNTAFSGSTPGANVELVWYTTPDHQPGTEVADPTNVTTSGTYYAFFHDTVAGCFNTDMSTASVEVKILTPCGPCDAYLGQVPVSSTEITN